MLFVFLFFFCFFFVVVFFCCCCCFLFVFSYNFREHFPSIVFDGVNVKFVKDHKHLGITLSDNMKWNKHIESILSSASRIIGIMKKN